MTRISAQFLAIITFVAAASVSAAGTSAAQTSTSPLPAASPLAPLAYLEGSCWKGTFAGRNVTDEHCFEWIYNGRFLRDHHIVVGDSVPYEGETTYAWDAAEKQIVYWYIALPGFYSHGNVESNGDALIFHDNLRVDNGRELRTTWRRSGPDAYTVQVEDVTGGKSKELWSMLMRRSRSAR